MKVFVTGGTGVLGTRAVPALVAAGHEVSAVARSAETAELVRASGATPVAVDLFDADAVRRAVDGHDGVVHRATSIPPMRKAARPSALPAAGRAVMPSLATQLKRSLGTSSARLERASGWRPAHPSIRGSWWSSTGEGVRA